MTIGQVESITSPTSTRVDLVVVFFLGLDQVKWQVE